MQALQGKLGNLIGTVFPTILVKVGVKQVDKGGSSDLEEALHLNLVVHFIIMDNSELHISGINWSSVLD